MFDGPVISKQLTKDQWELVQPVAYHGRTETWTIEAGFITDFASVPRVLQWVMNPTDYSRAALLHDWLWARNRRGERPDPVDSDGLFRRALREESAPLWLRWGAWAVVRAAAILEGRPGRWGRVRGYLFIASPAVPVLSGVATLVSLI